ncbi:MAG TPA: hypothetical protein VD948_05635, partial [Rhodothermales bacterium]|nr:hypothetical protein [Rhodothermales bacterium]
MPRSARLLPILLLVLSACERVPEPATVNVTGTADDSLLAREQAAGPREDYRVVLTGLAPDTLTGRARFGPVIHGPTGQPMSVIRLNTGLDFGGGFFLLHPGHQLPGPGTYPLAPPLADSLRGKRLPSGFWVAYKRGLVYDLVSTQGEVVIQSKTDTLITGQFNATLAGRVALHGGRVQEGEVQAQGTFRARGEGAGFILGL